MAATPSRMLASRHGCVQRSGGPNTLRRRATTASAQLEFTDSNAPSGISFLLHQTATGQWLKHRGQNLYLAVAPKAESSAGLSTLGEQIVEGEMGEHGWTLMHRFNLCYD